MNSEQVSLESVADAGGQLCGRDIGRERVPPISHCLQPNVRSSTPCHSRAPGERWHRARARTGGVMLRFLYR